MSQSPESSVNYSFAGKRVLITGGGKGLGRSLIERLYKDNALVFTLERDASLVEQLKKEFPKIVAEVADISNWKQTQQLVKGFGPMDYLVNNAGIIIFEDFLNITEDQVDKIMDVDLKAVFGVTQAVARGMIANEIHGAIVNVASIGSHIATRGTCIYNSAKAAILMLTKSVAFELGKHNIRVNSVSPTAMNTPMFKANAGELPPDTFLNRQPLAKGQILEPDVLVNSILFLLSPLSSFTTGADIIVDGGCAAC
ncbi:D-erythrulose reductase [Orchesella cincta]|uniref:D-erythrulose reductase n=1 Tax=Orchesella cincta TaxID=48709 RepID=A0A1D2NHC8_ORCCI|nr:D-erythrulose reductase [Orchesella cincta]